MARATLSSAFAAAVLALSPALASEPDYLDWGRLVDSRAQVFEDPYRDMAPDELSALASLIRLQEQLEGASVDENIRPRIEARIEQRRGDLEAADIDVDWLLDQRWIVAERRRQAALAVNADLDGQPVQIGGFLIPAPPSEDGQHIAYLVPERGMCSHMPPPPPNQLLRVVMDDRPDVSRLYEPVVVRGNLDAQETQREIFVVDGTVPMWSAWTVEEATLDWIARP